MNNPQGRRLIPEYLLKYLRGIKEKGINISTLVDANGNPRFLLGEGTPRTISGITPKKCIWSLSGYVLNLTYWFELENGTSLTSAYLCDFNLPDFIKEKIITPYAGNRIELIPSLVLYASDFTTKNLSISVIKSDDGIQFSNGSNVTLPKAMTGVINFSLLIDL